MKVAVLGKVDQKGLSFLKENEFKVIEIENFEIQNLKAVSYTHLTLPTKA